MTKLSAYFLFALRSYLRQHRYIMDLVVIALFIILFEGFLKSSQETSGIWWVFAVLAIVLNFLTAPLVFQQDRGNTLHFLLARPDGRRYLLLSRILVIVAIDLFWVLLFALIYGLRFPSAMYFALIPPRLLVIALILLLSTLMISVSFTYRMHWTWLTFLLIVLGFVVNKQGIFPLLDAAALPSLLLLLLPPFYEISYLAVNLTAPWQSWLFLLAAFAQVALLWWFSARQIQRRDFV